MYSPSRFNNNTNQMRATSSSSRVVNASTSSARSLLALPASSAPPPPPSPLTKMKKSMEEHLKSLQKQRQTIQSNIERLCINSDSVDSEIETTRAILASFNTSAEVIDVDEEEEQYSAAAPEYNDDESESEAPAKPVNRKKRSYSSSDDEDGDDDNTQAAPKRQRVHLGPSDNNPLYIHQRLKRVLNALPMNRGFTTQEIAQAYTERYPDQSHFTWGKNLRQYMKEQYIPEGCMLWNEKKAGGSTYTRLKQIPL